MTTNLIVMAQLQNKLGVPKSPDASYSLLSYDIDIDILIYTPPYFFYFS